MGEEGTIGSRIITDIEQISVHMDYADFNKLINKIIDYADIITESKLAGLINFKYNLNSTQVNLIINLLLKIQAISKIHNIATKGLKDLDSEFISNIYSDTSHLESFSTYINLRNIVENRLNHQIQQYNINMNKTNTTTTMPINELIGHIKTYRDLIKSNVSTSTKIQHGFIAASLHDAYVLLLNKSEWWNDRTYMKFFFGDSEIVTNNQLLITKMPRKTLSQIKELVENVISEFEKIHTQKEIQLEESLIEENKAEIEKGKKTVTNNTKVYTRNDKMLNTPFGKQYGQKIDNILNEIINNDIKIKMENTADEIIKEKILPLYEKFSIDQKSLENEENNNDINLISEFLMNTNYGVKVFAEKFIQTDKKMSFNRFYTEEIKKNIQSFLSELFSIYVNNRFNTLFKIIKSNELKKFACAFVIKRIYQKLLGEISIFSSFLIKTLGKKGGIRV